MEHLDTIPSEALSAASNLVIGDFKNEKTRQKELQHRKLLQSLNETKRKRLAIQEQVTTARQTYDVALEQQQNLCFKEI